MPCWDGRTPAHYGIGRGGCAAARCAARYPYAGACRASVRPAHHVRRCPSPAIPTRVGVESGDAFPRREAPFAGASDPSRTR